MYSLPAAPLLAAVFLLAPMAPKQETSSRPAQPVLLPVGAEPEPLQGSPANTDVPAPELDAHAPVDGTRPSGEPPASADPLSPAVDRPPPREGVCDALGRSASDNRIPAGFFARLIWQESRFNPQAVSPAGARGIAQFMPATARQRGLDNPFDPAEAIAKSAELLGELTKRFGNVGLAAAAYNAGPKRTKAWLAGRKPLPAETKTYVRKVTGHSPEEWNGTKSWRQPLGLAAPCEQIADADPIPAKDSFAANWPKRECCRAAKVRAVVRSDDPQKGQQRRRPDAHSSSPGLSHSRPKPPHAQHHHA